MAQDVARWGEGARRTALEIALGVLADARAAMLAHNVEGAGAAASPFLALCGGVIGGWLLGHQAEEAEARLNAGDARSAFLENKRAARKYCASSSGCEMS